MLDKNYWKNRYQTEETGWDAGTATTPIITYFEQVNNKQAKILIPGCGRAHEAEYLHRAGFTNVYVCDWAEEPLEQFAQRLPDFPKAQLICVNFFDLEQNNFDYIIEQTFFCALPPDLRPNYVQKMWESLAEKGKLVGLMFDFPLSETGPPFGGDAKLYEKYFTSHFNEISILPCQNSIQPRLGSELFVEITAKKMDLV